MEWWTPEQAGLIGGILGGGLCGILLGAIGGGVCGPLAGKGIGRRFVMSYLGLLGVIGLGLLATGLVAVAVRQPYHVWYAMVLPGLLCTVLVGVMLFAMRKAYAAHDRRRLAAEEIRRG